MSIASEITRINTNIAAAYSKCSDKGATMPAPVNQNSANLADTIDSITGSSSIPIEKDINFYDYDGTRLYSYTFSEASNLSALPALPSHSGLIAQKWNYTLVAITTAATNSCKTNVGCLYDTTDGATKLYFSVRAGFELPEVQIYTAIESGKTLTVDWGDETSSTSSNTGEVVFSHTYAQFTEDTEVCISIEGDSFQLGSYNLDYVAGISQYIYLTRANIGSNCNMIRASSFRGCSTLATITIPDSVIAVGANAFSDCSNLNTIIIPDRISNIGSYTFYGCNGLNMISIPSGVDNISSSAFYRCNNLTEFIVPNSVNNIAESAFAYCLHLGRVDLTAYSNPNNIPSLANSNVFGSFWGKFIVANETMSLAFQAATNWSSFSSSQWEVKT